MYFGLAAKFQSGITDLGMKPKVEYLNMAKKILMVQNSFWLIHHTEIKRWQAKGDEEKTTSTWLSLAGELG